MGWQPAGWPQYQTPARLSLLPAYNPTKNVLPARSSRVLVHFVVPSEFFASVTNLCMIALVGVSRNIMTTFSGTKPTRNVTFQSNTFLFNSSGVYVGEIITGNCLAQEGVRTCSVGQLRITRALAGTIPRLPAGFQALNERFYDRTENVCAVHPFP